MPAKCITPEVRSQYKLVSLDSLIPEKSEVRVIDVLAEQFWQTWSKDHPQIRFIKHHTKIVQPAHLETSAPVLNMAVPFG